MPEFKNNVTLYFELSKLKGKSASLFLFQGNMTLIWLFSYFYKLITIDDFNSVKIDENGDDDPSNN